MYVIWDVNVMEFLNENYVVSNQKDAESFLRHFFVNDAAYIEFLKDLDIWPKELTNYKDVGLFLSDNIIVSYDKLKIPSRDDNFNKNLRLSVECFTFNHLHDKIMPLFYHEFKEEDLFVFSKSIELDKLNVSVEQLGGSKKYVIPIHAAVVELSNLDALKNPLEKVNCLRTTYDMVYAQLKSDLAEISAKTSVADEEIPIPVIEKKDVLPILMIVITKSKLMHFYSNIIYIQEYASNLNHKNHELSIINTFCTAIERIGDIFAESLLPVEFKVNKELDLKDIMQMMNRGEETEEEDLHLNKAPLRSHHIQRIRQLIDLSTSEN